jgi:hypothetical protein
MLAYALWTILGLHTVLLLVVQPDRIAASRICTAAAALLAVLCAVWRTSQLPARARPIWLWSAGGFLLWATAHLVETFLGGSAASNLAVDPSDFIYMIAAFPLLIGLSTTRETESIRTIFFLNCTQIVMAFVLSYHLLYGMARTPEAAATVMGRIYGLDCALLALMAALRLFAWETPEERRTLRTICTFLWTYLPIELAMDYASQHWNLQAGSLIDLLWSVPFALTAWLALTLPTGGNTLPAPDYHRHLCPGRLHHQPASGPGSLGDFSPADDPGAAKRFAAAELSGGSGTTAGTGTGSAGRQCETAAAVPARPSDLDPQPAPL